MPDLVQVRLGLILLPLIVACRGGSYSAPGPATPPPDPPAATGLGQLPVIRIDTIPVRSALGPPPGARARLGYTPVPAGTRLLLIVDGQEIGMLPPMEHPNDLRADSSAAGRVLAELLPSRIASLSILRRHHAVEQYGERASGGALIIETTRSGSSGAP